MVTTRTEIGGIATNGHVVLYYSICVDKIGTTNIATENRVSRGIYVYMFVKW